MGHCDECNCYDCILEEMEHPEECDCCDCCLETKEELDYYYANNSTLPIHYVNGEVLHV